METLSFTFGVLATVAVIAIAVLVVGAVKVLKMQNKIDSLERWTGDSENAMHSRISTEVTHIHHEIETNMKTVHTRLDSLNSYIDSRLDKLNSKLIPSDAKKTIIKD